MSWSRNFDKCQVCGTSERKHRGKGLCVNCYERNLYQSSPSAKASRLKSVRKWEFENAERKYAINTEYRKRNPRVAKHRPFLKEIEPPTKVEKQQEMGI